MKATPQNLTRRRWTVNGRPAAFAAATRNWGVVNEDDQALSRDGQHPSAWTTKRDAALIAPHAHDMVADPDTPFRWIDLLP